jgi:hypothetical protein
MAHKLQRRLERKVAKATLRRSIHDFVSRSKRQPLRSTTLISIGGAVGAAAGWVAGRKTAQSSS